MRIVNFVGVRGPKSVSGAAQTRIAPGLLARAQLIRSQLQHSLSPIQTSIQYLKCAALKPPLLGPAVLGPAIAAAFIMVAGPLAHAQQLRDPIYDPNIVESERNLGEPDLGSNADPDRTLVPRGPEDNGSTAQKRETSEDDVEQIYEDIIRAAEAAESRLRRGDLTDDEIVAAARHFSAQQAIAEVRTEREGDSDPDSREDDAFDNMAPAELYAPLGIRHRGFLFFPEIGLNSYFTDNVFSTRSNPQSDFGIEIAPSLRIASDWSNHALGLEVGGTRQYLNTFSEEGEREFHSAVSGRIDIRRSTKLEGRLSYDFDTESRSSQELPDDAAERTPTREFGGELTLSHTINRATVALRGGATSFDYEDVRLNSGAIDNNDDRDYVERHVGARASYEFSPRLTVFADGEINRHVYTAAMDDSGIRRGSDGYALSGGLAIDTGKLRGTAQVGYAVQVQKDRQIADLEGFIFAADLEYGISALTRLNFRAAGTLDETVTDGSAGARLQSYELELAHALRRHFDVIFGVRYENTDYMGITLERNELTGYLGADYYMTRERAITARFESTRSDGTNADDSYTENTLRVGMKLRR